MSTNVSVVNNKLSTYLTYPVYPHIPRYLGVLRKTGPGNIEAVASQSKAGASQLGSKCTLLDERVKMSKIWHQDCMRL